MPRTKATDGDSVQTFPKYAVDGGNWAIKFASTSGEVGIIPSFVTDVPAYQDIRFSKNSILIEYQKGIPELEGIRFVVGEAARNLGACGTYLTDKAVLSPRLVLAAIAPASKSVKKIVVDNLVVCTPNDLVKERKNILQDCLAGVHQIVRNGVPLEVRIKQVQVVDEVDGTYRLAVSQKIYRDTTMLNGVINIGSKHMSACVFLPDGTKDLKSRLITGGVIHLASEISMDEQFLTELDEDPDLALIVQGIENQSYQYGTTGIDFHDSFKNHHELWIKSLRDQLREKWKSRANRLGEIVISGGGASLCSEMAKAYDRYKLIASPQFANVKGMVL